MRETSVLNGYVTIGSNGKLAATNGYFTHLITEIPFTNEAPLPRPLLSKLIHGDMGWWVDVAGGRFHVHLVHPTEHIRHSVRSTLLIASAVQFLLFFSSRRWRG